jgi:hypothetical protein
MDSCLLSLGLGFVAGVAAAVMVSVVVLMGAVSVVRAKADPD